MRVWKETRSYGQVYNCASSEKTTVGELSDIIMDEYGTVEIEYAEPLEGDIFWFNVNTDKMQQLGVNFRGLREGIKTIL